jgi:hypothetical protein
MHENIKYNIPHMGQEKSHQKEKKQIKQKISRDSKVAIEWVHQRINEMVLG